MFNKIKNFLSRNYYVIMVSFFIALTIMDGIKNYQLTKSYYQMNETLIESQKTVIKVHDAYVLQHEIIEELLVKLKESN